MYPEDPPEPTTEEYYEDQLAQAVAHIEELTDERDNLKRDLDHFKRDWLAMLREIAKLYDAVQDLDESEAWQHAGDATVWQEFDPWQALTVATATVKAGRDGAGPIANKTAPRISKLEAENRRLFGALQDLEAAYGQIAPEDWPGLIEDVVLQLISEIEEAPDDQ